MKSGKVQTNQNLRESNGKIHCDDCGEWDWLRDSEAFKKNHICKSNKEVIKESKKYRVFDEMSCSDILETNNKQEAFDSAYNHQCLLYCRDLEIRDYSC